MESPHQGGLQGSNRSLARVAKSSQCSFQYQSMFVLVVPKPLFVFTFLGHSSCQDLFVHMLKGRKSLANLLCEYLRVRCILYSICHSWIKQMDNSSPSHFLEPEESLTPPFTVQSMREQLVTFSQLTGNCRPVNVKMHLAYYIWMRYMKNENHMKNIFPVLWKRVRIVPTSQTRQVPICIFCNTTLGLFRNFLLQQFFHQNMPICETKLFCRNIPIKSRRLEEVFQL